MTTTSTPSVGELNALIRKLGFSLNRAAITALTDYLTLLLRWNTSINLVGTHSWQSTVEQLIVDSLYLESLVRSLPLPKNPLCWDPGAGAGLPGIPLRMLWEQGTYWLIESREKRALFLSIFLARHPLPGTYVFRGRLEYFLSTHADGRRPANVIISRAFMPWQDLIELVGPHLAPDGCIILLLNNPIPDTFSSEKTRTKNWNILKELVYPVGKKQRILTALVRQR